MEIQEYSETSVLSAIDLKSAGTGDYRVTIRRVDTTLPLIHLPNAIWNAMYGYYPERKWRNMVLGNRWYVSVYKDGTFIGRKPIATSERAARRAARRLARQDMKLREAPYTVTYALRGPH
jgi:hypothetical protein